LTGIDLCGYNGNVLKQELSMFAWVKKSDKYQYLQQLVENCKEKGRVKQQVIATLGCMDELSAKGRVETLIRSLSRFSHSYENLRGLIQTLLDLNSQMYKGEEKWVKPRFWLIM
jgi:uncharacterized membrane protein